MIELTYTGTTAQTVTAGQPILYNSVIVKSGCAEHHRTDSGMIKLIKPGRYLVTFGGNIAAVTTAEEISVAIAQDGEAMNSTTMTVTPAAIGEYFNVSAQTYIDVPMCCGQTCCVDISVENINTQSITVLNPNFTAVRVNG